MTLFTARTVSGISLPRRRFTGWATLYFLVYVGVPILAIAFLLDVLIFYAIDEFLDQCYGVLCLLN